MDHQTISEVLAKKAIGSTVILKGWVRTFRSNRFIALNDGSTIKTIQVVVDFEKTSKEVLDKITTGACIEIKGDLVKSLGKGQDMEVHATDVRILGECDPNEYPLQPKKHSMEFLREIAHLRPRTNTFAAILRIRHTLAFAIHQYFNERGFAWMHTPVITGSDAEGAGEMFNVSVLDKKNIPLTEDGEVDYKKDFFGKEANLTVSGQLEAELGALALGKVYTFGPTFRAENSNTTRHLAEFWMIEPEVAFADLDDN
ncbi:MAG: amino acid--tRNA ligase-related protein, partial [Owenweeksia sp.]